MEAEKTILATVEESVGLITIRTFINREVYVQTGTGCHVGNGYLMTAYNVFGDKIGELINEMANVIPDDALAKTWRSNFLKVDENLELRKGMQVFLDKSPEKKILHLVKSLNIYFNYEVYEDAMEVVTKVWYIDCDVSFQPTFRHRNQVKTRFKFTLSPDIPFADKQNDVMFLKIEKSSEKLQTRLLLDEEYEEFGSVNIYGCIAKREKTMFDWEKNCKVYSNEEQLKKDIEVGTLYIG